MPSNRPIFRYARVLVPLCRRAGEVILDHYDSDGAVEHSAKQDQSPLTAADMDSHHLLLEGLEGLGLPVLSEESPRQVQEARRQSQRFWLIDPLDGTREFLERTGEFTVNVALIDGGRAVFGLVGVPVSGSIYLGIPGEGAWCVDRHGWQSIRCRPLAAGAPLVVQTSRRHRGAQLDGWLQGLNRAGWEFHRRHAGSALKFCELARGAADCYPRFAPCSEWDTAAGQALLEAAGGAVLDECGRPLCYNQRDSLLSPHFVALADPSQGLWHSLWGESDRQ